MRVTMAVLMLTVGCTSCALPTPPPPEPPRLVFKGELDLTGQGVGVTAAHEESGLICRGRYPSGRLPDPVSIEVKCNNEQTGLLTLNKTPGLHGPIAIVDGVQGDVVFDPPPTVLSAPVTPVTPVVVPATAHPSAVTPAVRVTAPSPVIRTTTVTYVPTGRGGCGSRGGPGYRLASGKCASYRHGTSRSRTYRSRSRRR
jgi:hypothetical protein